MAVSSDITTLSRRALVIAAPLMALAHATASISRRAMLEQEFEAAWAAERVAREAIERDDSPEDVIYRAAYLRSCGVAERILEERATDLAGLALKGRVYNWSYGIEQPATHERLAEESEYINDRALHSLLRDLLALS